MKSLLQKVSHVQRRLMSEKLSFGERWQFFHAVGALDGKQIGIKCPRNGGSLYCIYKVSRYSPIIKVTPMKKQIEDLT